MIASTSVALTAQVGWPVKGVINSPPARTLVLMKKKKGSIRRKEPGIGGRPVMLVRRRVAHSAAPFILLVCGAAGVRLGAWRPVGSIAVVREESEQESGIDALTPLPVWERLAGETPRAGSWTSALVVQRSPPLSLPAWLPAQEQPARPHRSSSVTLCCCGRGRGRTGGEERREPRTGGRGGQSKRTPVPKPDPGQDLNWN